MDETNFRFKIGTFDCLAICDSSLTSRWNALFGNIPRDELEQMLARNHLSLDQVTTPSTCLVINTGQHQVLIDTGRGAGFGLPPSPVGELIQRLTRQGIDVSDIDTVILSHLHAGHAGGVINARHQLTFGNARHVLWREEWEFWQAMPDLRSRGLQGMVTFAQGTTHVIERQLTLVEREAEIVPGIHVIAAPGHSAGHIGVRSGRPSGSQTSSTAPSGSAITRPMSVGSYARCG